MTERDTREERPALRSPHLSSSLCPPPPVPTLSLQPWLKPQGLGLSGVVEGAGAAWGLPEAGTHHWSPKSAGRCLRTWEVKVKSINRVQLCNPMAVAHQAPPSMEFSRQEYWSGLPFPSPGDLLDLGIELASLASLALAGKFFTTELPGKPLQYEYSY